MAVMQNKKVKCCDLQPHQSNSLSQCQFGFSCSDANCQAQNNKHTAELVRREDQNHNMEFINANTNTVLHFVVNKTAPSQKSQNKHCRKHTQQSVHVSYCTFKVQHNSVLQKVCSLWLGGNGSHNSNVQYLE